MASFSTKWRKRRASSGFVSGQFGAAGLTTEEIIIRRKRSGLDGGRSRAMPVDTGGLFWDEDPEATGEESHTVSDSSGSLSGLEPSLLAV